MKKPAGKRGTTISDEPDARVRDVSLTRDTLSLSLMDGRLISAPLAWFPRLLKGSKAQRSDWRIIGNGVGVHWPDLDEDISPNGLLRGQIPEIADRREPAGRRPRRASAA